MNFNYSYRAFLITSLLFGILALGLFSIKLGNEIPKEEPLSNYDVEYVEEIPEPEKKEITALSSQRRKIETNRAFNEAERFIEEAENFEEESSFEERLSEMDNALNDATASNQGSIRAAKERIEAAKRNKRAAKTTGGSKSVNKNTTISYRLVNRVAMELPNPVYTCEGFGKIVISITVDELGRVTKADYNKSLSTTTNGCLIDEALTYAHQARFNTKNGSSAQLGTITYNFPGQD